MHELLWGGPIREEWVKDEERWWEPPRLVRRQDMRPMTSLEFTQWRALVEIVEVYEQEQAEQ